MSPDEVRSVVRVILAVMTRIGGRTRTHADDMMVRVLKTNEDRLSDAVVALLMDPQQPLSEERITAALAAVGIKV